MSDVTCQLTVSQSADSGHEVGHGVLEALRVRAHDLDRRHVRVVDGVASLVRVRVRVRVRVS